MWKVFELHHEVISKLSVTFGHPNEFIFEAGLQRSKGFGTADPSKSRLNKLA